MVVSVRELVRGLGLVFKLVYDLGLSADVAKSLAEEVKECTGGKFKPLYFSDRVDVVDTVVRAVELPSGFVDSVNKLMVEEIPRKVYFLGQYTVEVGFPQRLRLVDLNIRMYETPERCVPVSEGYIIKVLAVDSGGKLMMVTSPFARAEEDGRCRYYVKDVEEHVIVCRCGENSVKVDFYEANVLKERCDASYSCDELFSKVLGALAEVSTTYNCMIKALTEKIGDVVKKTSILSLYP